MITMLCFLLHRDMLLVISSIHFQFDLLRLRLLCEQYIEASISTKNVLVALECAEELGLEFIKVTCSWSGVYQGNLLLVWSLLGSSVSFMKFVFIHQSNLPNPSHPLSSFFAVLKSNS